MKKIEEIIKTRRMSIEMGTIEYKQIGRHSALDTFIGIEPEFVEERFYEKVLFTLDAVEQASDKELADMIRLPYLKMQESIKKWKDEDS